MRKLLFAEKVRTNQRLGVDISILGDGFTPFVQSFKIIEMHELTQILDVSLFYFIFLIVMLCVAVSLGLWFGHVLGTGTAIRQLREQGLSRFFRKKVGQTLAYLWHKNRSKTKQKKGR